MAKSLFITYDGITDPLGQSQILPYLAGLSNAGHEISILSCEKAERYSKYRNNIEELCKKHGIRWNPLLFHRTPPILSKYYDLYRLTSTAFRMQSNEEFDIIHCRSYLSADVGMKLKRRFQAKFLFDMRGFWVDERVDGGLWNMKLAFYRFAYKKWKRKEASFIRNADHIVSLTQAAKTEIQNWNSYSGAPISVIPCSADLDLFTPSRHHEKAEAKKRLNIPSDSLVLSYLGSLGTWYMLKEMLLLFKKMKERYHGAKFLILTPDKANEVFHIASSLGLVPDDFVIRFAQRSEVPQLIRCSDVSVSFIRPTYSKMASSPTKLGELLAMKIPVICNDIGDVSQIISMTNGGFIMKDFSDNSFNSAVDYINQLGTVSEINHGKVEAYYSLTQAVMCYNKIYESLKG